MAIWVSVCPAWPRASCKRSTPIRMPLPRMPSFAPSPPRSGVSWAALPARSMRSCLLRAAAVLEQSPQSTPDIWSRAFTAAVEGVMEIGGAHPGDRTMVDALALPPQPSPPPSQIPTPPRHRWMPAVTAASTGAAETAAMQPRLGRSSYVGERALGFPDPGAYAVSLWLAAIRNSLAS